MKNKYNRDAYINKSLNNLDAAYDLLNEYMEDEYALIQENYDTHAKNYEQLYSILLDLDGVNVKLHKYWYEHFVYSKEER